MTMTTTKTCSHPFQIDGEPCGMCELLDTTPSGLRMYFFVMYNLSGIQKGIQAGHAALEYARKYGHQKQYQEFIDLDKTFILLDGGGSRDMVTRVQELFVHGIQHVIFNEPDLSNSISAIAFIVPEVIYNFDVDAYCEGDLRYSEENYTLFQYLRSFKLASN